MTRPTSQEAFETVARHLLKQNRKSQGGNGICLYHRDDGFKCAIGCLIPGDVYAAGMEENDIEDLIENFPAIIPFLPENNMLLSRLQALHDRHEPHDWEEGLLQIARNHHLDATFLDGVS